MLYPLGMSVRMVMYFFFGEGYRIMKLAPALLPSLPTLSTNMKIEHHIRKKIQKVITLCCGWMR